MSSPMSSRQDAQQLLAQPVEAEVADWIEREQDCRGAAGRRQVVYNGHPPAHRLISPERIAAASWGTLSTQTIVSGHQMTVVVTGVLRGMPRPPPGAYHDQRDVLLTLGQPESD